MRNADVQTSRHQYFLFIVRSKYNLKLGLKGEAVQMWDRHRDGTRRTTEHNE